MRRNLLPALLALVGALAVLVTAPGLVARTASTPTSQPTPPPSPSTSPLSSSPSSTSPPTVPVATTGVVEPTPPPSTTSPSIPAARPGTTLPPGDEGAAVLALQHRLQELGYWLGTPDGSYGGLTEQAVMAFQKVEGLIPDGVAGASTRRALEEAGRADARSETGDLVEVDTARQVVLVVRGGRVAWVLNTSTGTGEPYRVGGSTEVADTPSGRWRVERVVDGVRQAALGSLYRPRYFHADGIAVHGSSSVPAYPASHGCVRVTNAAMDWIWASDVLALGSTVWIY